MADHKRVVLNTGGVQGMGAPHAEALDVTDSEAWNALAAYIQGEFGGLIAAGTYWRIRHEAAQRSKGGD